MMVHDGPWWSTIFTTRPVIWDHVSWRGSQSRIDPLTSYTGSIVGRQDRYNMSSHDFLTKRIDRHIGKWLLSVVNVAWCAISHATPLPFLSFASAPRQWAHNSRQKQHLTNCVLNKQDQTLHSSSWPISLWSVFLNWSIRFPASSLVKRKKKKGKRKKLRSWNWKLSTTTTTTTTTATATRSTATATATTSEKRRRGQRGRQEQQGQYWGTAATTRSAVDASYPQQVLQAMDALRLLRRLPMMVLHPAPVVQQWLMVMLVLAETMAMAMAMTTDMVMAEMVIKPYQQLVWFILCSLLIMLIPHHTANSQSINQ